MNTGVFAGKVSAAQAMDSGVISMVHGVIARNSRDENSIGPGMPKGGA